MQTKLTILASALALGTIIAGSAQAQETAKGPTEVKRTILQRFEVPGPNYDTVMAISELGPNGDVGRQSHPGPESGYVLEGSGTITLDSGKTIELKQGASYQLPANAVHTFKSGPEGVKILAVWDLEKGKPMTASLK